MNTFIVDTSICNIHSLKSALNFLGIDYNVSKNKSELKNASHIILPGVGSFDEGMKKLSEYDLLEILYYLAKVKKIPFLGICLGMQLMFENSEEGILSGLGILEGKIMKLNTNNKIYKVPNIGFNQINQYTEKGLFKDFISSPYFYFTHSYALFSQTAQSNNALTKHSKNFISAFQYKNICATQFHPEKSQSNGLKLLYNFFSTVK